MKHAISSALSGASVSLTEDNQNDTHRFPGPVSSARPPIITPCAPHHVSRVLARGSHSSIRVPRLCQPQESHSSCMSLEMSLESARQRQARRRQGHIAGRQAMCAVAAAAAPLPSGLSQVRLTCLPGTPLLFTTILACCGGASLAAEPCAPATSLRIIPETYKPDYRPHPNISCRGHCPRALPRTKSRRCFHATQGHAGSYADLWY